MAIEAINSITRTTTTYRMSFNNDAVKVEFEREIGESWMPVQTSITSIWVKLWGFPDYIDILPFTCELRDTAFGEPIFDLQDDIVKATQGVLADLFTPFLYLEEDGRDPCTTEIVEVSDDEDDEEEGFRW